VCFVDALFSCAALDRRAVHTPIRTSAKQSHEILISHTTFKREEN